VPSGNGSSSASSSSRGREPTKLPERFLGLDDVVAKELAELDYPWNLKAIEERIQEYSSCSEAINAQLSARVMANYNEFVQGMQQVQAVETELSLIGVLVKNGRRKLQNHDSGIVRGSMQITLQQRKKERLKELLALLEDFQGVVEIDGQLRERLSAEKYCEAIVQHAALRDALGTQRFAQFPGLVGLQDGMSSNLSLVQQKLSDGLRVAAVSAEFDAERYEEILKAYSMLSADQAISVGKEILRHVSECIVAVSRQCMLAFSMAPAHESPADWHRKAQLRDLCRSMDPSHFVSCGAQLYEHLCDFLYRHQFLCAWHVQRSQAAESENIAGEGAFREVLRAVHTELVSSKRNVWDRIQQQVSLVLMTLDFQYPALTEDGFMHLLHLTRLLIDEGDAFMADNQAIKGGSSQGRREASAPIRNTLKSKANDYFQSLHYNAWANFKVAHIEQDSWQRLPVARNYSLLRADRLKPVLPRGHESGGKAAEQGKPRTSENNPFRNYKPENFTGLGVSDGRDDATEDSSRALEVSADELDEHALLQHWIDESSSGVSNELIGSSLLSNSNRSPVVSSSTVELARILERYCRLMAAMPLLAKDIWDSAVSLVEFYIHCMLCLFAQDRHLKLLLEDLDFVPANDPRLLVRQEALFLQQLVPNLRQQFARVRDVVSNITLPDSCAANLGLQAPVLGNVLLQVTTFSKLSSPTALCGLSERCIGVESVGALLNGMRDVQSQISALLPKGSEDVMDNFFESHEKVAMELRTFVLMYAARDVLEVPDVGRISLDHFSTTVSALRWEASGFGQGSPAAPYLQNLRGQIDELARRIPCAGGGAIPYATQRMVWGWLEVRIMHECLEVVAKCGRKKSHEALLCLAADFQSIRSSVQVHFKAAEDTEELNLLPQDHPLGAFVQWSYLDEYLEAHGYTGNEIGVWCKRHAEYPLRLQKALIDYAQGANQKVARQTMMEVEAFVASSIADEGASFSQRGF